MKRGVLSMVVPALLACMSVQGAEATSAVFPGLRIRGTLTSAGGPVNAAVTITVRVYAVPTGGAPVYSEAFADVKLASGELDLVVGAGLGTTNGDLVAALSPTPGEPFERYLTMQIEPDTEELLPRQRLAAAPFAGWAAGAAVAAKATSADSAVKAASAGDAAAFGGLAPTAYRGLADAQTSLGCVLGADLSVSCEGKRCTDASTLTCALTLAPECQKYCVDGSQGAAAIVSKLAANVNVPEAGVLAIDAPALLACAIDRPTRVNLDVLLNGDGSTVMAHEAAAQLVTGAAPTGAFDVLPGSGFYRTARVAAGNFGSIAVAVEVLGGAPYSSKAMCFALAQPIGITFQPAELKSFTSAP